MSRAPYVSLHVTSGSRRVGAAEIVASVEREINRGGLPAGARLPPVRVLEAQLGLSKNTAQVAYEELVARGLVEARSREGVFVLAASRLAAPQPIGRPPLPVLVPPPLPAVESSAGMTQLTTVFVDPALLPTERIAECARAALRDGMPTAYDAQGLPSLRAAIARRLAARGIDVAADHIIITTGSQQSLDLVARALVSKRIAVESPVYAYAKLLFENLGHQLVGLPLDPLGRGIDLEQWDRALATRPALAYLIPSFQNPTGYSYSSTELHGVLGLCERHGVPILEDDWGSDMLSDGDYRPGLRMLGGPDVLYVNSFTKKLLPALRVGFIAAPPALIPTLLGMKRLATLGNPWLTEAIVAEFLDRGYYDTHLAALQRALDARYAACLVALDELMPPGVTWTRPGGGPTLWLELPRTVDLAAVIARAAQHRVAISNVSVAHVGEPARLHGFRVAYAYLTEERMRGALAVVADAIRAVAPV